MKTRVLGLEKSSGHRQLVESPAFLWLGVPRIGEIVQGEEKVAGTLRACSHMWPRVRDGGRGSEDKVRVGSRPPGLPPVHPPHPTLQR